MAVYSEWPLPLPSPHQTNQQNRIESNPLHLAAAANACSTGRSLARMSYAYLIKYIIVGDTGVGKSCTGWKRLSMNCSSRHESNGTCKNLVALIIRSIRCGFGVLLPVVQGQLIEDCVKRYGALKSSQFIDVVALSGDKADNILVLLIWNSAYC
ncbi:hypothetical protein EJB05_56028 [Eragrostis curvula]|uniref:Uncharacterized protein n=1 Tax=Eragrostis curvula TaxID=38414 RepID=A0A5J9SH78_9POAL|nr:hypothetical protein EJB05_56028 [Eragrostis curvula]